MATKIVHAIKRRLALSYSSLVAFKKPIRRVRRVKQVQIRISRRTAILLKYRTFRTRREHRSRHTHQLVIPILFSHFREVAVSVQRSVSIKSQPKTYTFVVTVRPTAIINYMMIVTGLIGTALFGYQVVRSASSIAPQQVVSSFAVPTPQPVTDYSQPVFMARSEPVQLRIPSIAVNAQITTVGRLEDGTMETPPVSSAVTGWYRYSPTPGEQGPSVIVGHVDDYRGPSVFWRLHELAAGDTFEVTRADESVATFAVTSVQQFDQASFPTAEVYGDTEYAGIRLITCGGTFNHQTGHYTQNTVVFGILQNK